jgi:hypothetical protein
MLAMPSVEFAQMTGNRHYFRACSQPVNKS